MSEAKLRELGRRLLVVTRRGAIPRAIAVLCGVGGLVKAEDARTELEKIEGRLREMNELLQKQSEEIERLRRAAAELQGKPTE
jgi:hypothetical protein